MSTKYEEYSGYTGGMACYGAKWFGQTFTPSTAHTLASVKVKLTKAAGASGTITFAIYATTSGHPSGSVLCSGTIEASTLSDSVKTEHEITMGTEINLAASTQYALVASMPSGSGTNYIRWWAGSGSYSGGCYEQSTDSGATWASGTSTDFDFETWGNAIVSFIPKCVFF